MTTACQRRGGGVIHRDKTDNSWQSRTFHGHSAFGKHPSYSQPPQLILTTAGERQPRDLSPPVIPFEAPDCLAVEHPQRIRVVNPGLVKYANWSAIRELRPFCQYYVVRRDERSQKESCEMPSLPLLITHRLGAFRSGLATIGPQQPLPLRQAQRTMQLLSSRFARETSLRAQQGYPLYRARLSSRYGVDQDSGRPQDFQFWRR